MTIDLEVGGVTLFGVEVTDNGETFEYRVPDCIAIKQPESKVIQQVTIEHGIGPAVKKSDLKEALQNHLADLQSGENVS